MAEETQRVYGECKVNYAGENSISSQTATIETVLDLAQEIWKYVKLEWSADRSYKDCERLEKRLWVDYKDFADSYPIVIKWMTYSNEYCAESFEYFLKNYAKIMYKDKDDFAECQAEYIVHMFRRKNKRVGNKYIQMYRENVIKHFKEDNKRFKEACDKVEDEVKKLDEEAMEDKRKRLFRYIMAEKNGEASSSST